MGNAQHASPRPMTLPARELPRFPKAYTALSWESVGLECGPLCRPTVVVVGPACVVGSAVVVGATVEFDSGIVVGPTVVVANAVVGASVGQLPSMAFTLVALSSSSQTSLLAHSPALKQT